MKDDRGISLQSQYDRIYSYFRTTCEPFDLLEWDGRVLQVWNEDVLIEEYHLKDIYRVLPTFNLQDK